MESRTEGETKEHVVPGVVVWSLSIYPYITRKAHLIMHIENALYKYEITIIIIIKDK